MKKFIEIGNETLQTIMDGRCVEGSLRVDMTTGCITFRPYRRRLRRSHSNIRTVCVLEHGWLKESAERFKFYNSVPKTLGVGRTAHVMQRELTDAVQTLIVEAVR